MKDITSGMDDSFVYGDKGLKGIMLDNSSIKSVNDKPIVLVFGQDGCYYCRMLVNNISGDDVLKEYLMSNFSPYYINVSSGKRHGVGFLQLQGVTSKDFARLYGFSFTPLIVFVDMDNEVIMRIQGYPGDGVMLKALDYISNDRWKVYKSERDIVRGFMHYAGISLE